MDVWFTYIIKYLLLPGSSLLILAIIGLYKTKQQQKTGLTWLLAAVLGYFVLSLPLVANQMAKLLEKYPHFTATAETATQYQAIVILGGGTHKNSYEYGHNLTINDRTLERIRYGAKLSKDTGLPVLVSGGRVFGTTEFPEAQLMANVLQEFGVSARWRESRSRNTSENALYAREVLKPLNINRILLVTHVFHMPRAAIEFRRVGFTVQPAPTSNYYIPNDINIFSFIPTAEAFYNSSLMAHEYLGLVWYSLKAHLHG